MSSEFESLLERMVPGSARRDAGDADAPLFPRELGLEPRGVLARGGTGWVHRAWDPVLAREVAVKIARPEGGDVAREALLREARVTSGLEHPAILPVHRVCVAAGLVCVEFRLAPATTLESLLVDWRADPAAAWPIPDRLALLLGVASALMHAHARGVIHGDLHPGNLAVTSGREPYVLDWSGLPLASGTLGGAPGWAAPEQLRGEAGGPSSDLYALGAVAWEIVTLRPFRPRRHGEELGDYVARWRDADPPAVASAGDLDADVAGLCARLSAREPAARPPAGAVVEALEGMIAHRAESARRRDEAEALLGRSRDALSRFEELVGRYAEERRVVAVQRTKVPGHAPVGQKRRLWEAEDRLAALAAERDGAWVEAADAADRALALQAGIPEANEVLAQLWWIRMEDAESRKERGLARVFAQRVLHYDDGRWARRLHAKAELTLSASVAGATGRLYRFRESGRRLVPELVEARALPFERLSLPPGSWLVEIDAPGMATARYPVLLRRLDHHRGRVRLYRPEEVGEAWVQVPAGPFRLGGDPLARQPLDPCSPVLGDLFVQRTCVRSADWLAFLEDLPPEEAALRVPGEAGLFGGFRAYWHREARWELPEGWDPDWPVMAVNLADVEAYAQWLSAREGRRVRLPTEEEWEKAARGVDGRAYPWGDGFDPTFAHMRQSRPGTPSPAPVGAYPVDTSVYGCMDMAGGMREWTSSQLDEGQQVIRGGTWGDDADDLRLACRSGLHAGFRYSFVGFRLVTEEPRVVEAHTRVADR